MRENRSYGSEGGEGQPFPTPIAQLILLQGFYRAALCILHQPVQDIDLCYAVMIGEAF
jgi:hypothetical protein